MNGVALGFPGADGVPGKEGEGSDCFLLQDVLNLSKEEAIQCVIIHWPLCELVWPLRVKS
jgi:hypothetical protein